MSFYVQIKIFGVFGGIIWIMISIYYRELEIL